MKALITGGAGFAASHLAEYLLRMGQEVIAVIRPSQQDLTNIEPILSRIRVERADLGDENCLLRILGEIKPDRIYHLAARTSPAKSFQDPRLTYEVNFVGTLNLLSAIRQVGLDCRVLYVSSAEVYGAVESGQLPLREEAPFHPDSPYAGSKAAAEVMAMQFFKSYGLPIVRSRPFNHTGPRQSAVFVCSNFARQFAEVDAGLRSPTITVGNLHVRRDFSDVRDIVRGYHLLLEKGKAGEVYQLGSGRSVSIEQILQTLTGLSSQPVQIVVDPARLKPGEAPDRWGTTRKAEQAVGWKCQYPLDATLQDLKRYWDKNLQSRKSSAQQGTAEAC